LVAARSAKVVWNASPLEEELRHYNYVTWKNRESANSYYYYYY